jgi:hypothetical protein
MTFRVDEEGGWVHHMLLGRNMGQGILEYFKGPPLRKDMVNRGYRWLRWWTLPQASHCLGLCKGRTTLDLEDSAQWDWEYPTLTENAAVRIK